LFSATPVAFESAGFFTAKVTPKMTYSAKLIVDGNTVGISGKLKIDGTGSAVSKVRIKADKPELMLNLAMDFAGGTDSLSGTVVQPTGATNWTANLLAYRSPWTLSRRLTGRRPLLVDLTGRCPTSWRPHDLIFPCDSLEPLPHGGGCEQRDTTDQVIVKAILRVHDRHGHRGSKRTS